MKDFILLSRIKYDKVGQSNEGGPPMKQEFAPDKSQDPDTNLLPWNALLEKGRLWKEHMSRLALRTSVSYRITKSCTDGTFHTGDIILLESGNDLFCPKTGQRITPGKCTRENMDFECTLKSL